MHRPLRTLLAPLTLVLALSAPAAAESFTDAEKTEIETLIRAYLLENPELVREALVALEAKEKAAEESARAETLASMTDVIFNSTRQVVLGDPAAPITVVEFFDYNCGYCKRAYDDTMAILEEEKDVRIVLKEMPILGPGSVEAARVAVALNLVAPEHYPAFHADMMTGGGQADELRALAAVEAAGADVDAVRKAMADPEIANTLEEVYSIANRLGITGTPTYVIGDEVVFGAVGIDELRSKVAAVRSCGRATC